MTYQEHVEKWDCLNNAHQILQYRRRKDVADEELLRSFQVGKKALRATEQAMEDLYRRFGPKFVCPAMDALSKSQRALEKRLQNMVIRIIRGSGVAEQMLLDHESDCDDKMAQRMDRAEVRAKKAEKEKEKEKGVSSSQTSNRNSGNNKKRPNSDRVAPDSKRRRRDGDAPKKSSVSGSGPVCFLCHSAGHMKKDCPDNRGAK